MRLLDVDNANTDTPGDWDIIGYKYNKYGQKTSDLIVINSGNRVGNQKLKVVIQQRTGSFIVGWENESKKSIRYGFRLLSILCI